jgi:cytoskeletal protein CcmA (bactofilin family)
MSFLRKRDQDDEDSPDVATPVAPAKTAPTSEQPPVQRPRSTITRGEPSEMANIGKSISIKGDVSGDEDTVIEGRVEGRIELKNHHLTVGPNGDVKGEINAKQVTVVGKVNGNVTATERIELSDSGRVSGDLASPRLLIQEGGQLNGSVSMKGAAATTSTQPQVSTQPQPAKKLDHVGAAKTA